MQLEVEPLSRASLLVSHDLKKRLVTYGLPESKMKVAYLGTNANVPLRVASSDRPFVIGFLNRLEPVKQPAVFIDTLRHLKRRGLAPVVCALGDGRFRAEFHRQCEELLGRRAVFAIERSAQLWNQVPPLNLIAFVFCDRGCPVDHA